LALSKKFRVHSGRPISRRFEAVLSSSRIEILLGFIKQKPTDPFPRYALAMEYKNAGRLEDARRTFDELMGANPDYTAAYLHAGNVFFALGDIDRARSVYEAGIVACARRGDTHARAEIESALATLPAVH
jgi:tetratricopeptide (TPR) repeat protein